MFQKINTVISQLTHANTHRCTHINTHKITTLLTLYNLTTVSNEKKNRCIYFFEILNIILWFVCAEDCCVWLMSLALPSVNNYTLVHCCVCVHVCVSVCVCMCKIEEHTFIYLISGVDPQFEGNASSKLVSFSALGNRVRIDFALHVYVLVRGDVEELNGH